MLKDKLKKISMTTYSMAQVETLTGIKAHTLRMWERRYDFLNPCRTETNIRFFFRYSIGSTREFWHFAKEWT